MKIMYQQFMDSLSEIYISIFALDLKNNDLHAIKSNPFIDKLIGIPGSLQERMRNVMGYITVEDHLDVIKEFTDVTTLPDRLKDTNVITQVFKGKINGWCKARFIRIPSEETTDVRYVLYTVECIDDDKRKEDYLRYQAQTDLMTGICNRGYGEKTIDAYLQSKRQGLFVLFDIDKFKRINDIYGHKTGDMALIAIADALKAVASTDDVIMRLGGDEFAAYFVDIDSEEKGHLIITKLLDKIAEINIAPMNEGITVSLGAALYEEGLDFDKAYQMADKGVYESKLNKGSSFILCNNRTE